MKGFFFVISFIFMLDSSFGQQQVNFTQYMFNPLYLNPAAAGTENALSITATTRYQWTGIKGAPSIQMLTAHMPIPNTKAGVGLAVHNDKIGYSNETGAYGFYSYKINLSERRWSKGRFIPSSTFSIGLRAGFDFYSNDVTKANLSANPTGNPDQNFQIDYKAQLFNFGFGLIYKIDKFYLSLSIPSLINNSYYVGKPGQVRHFFLATGTTYLINSNIKAQPNILLKVAEGVPAQFDLNINFVYNDLIWAGLTYRTLESIDFLFQMQTSKVIRFGYSFDLITNELMANARGTHELIIKLSLPTIKAPKNTCVNPNYF
jgi:type IX secretion system PorP/SprF family membrane protein